MRNDEKRMLRARSLVAIAGGALAMGVVGCATDYTCVDYATCPFEAGVDGKVTGDGRADTSKPRGDGGVDGATDGPHQKDVGGADIEATPDSNTCDTTASPKDAPCVVNESLGVFVAPAANGGSDATGTGTRSAPYATIGKGISSAAGKRVYICGATYGEQLVVAQAQSLIGVFGGLACPVGADGGGATDASAEAGSGGAWTYTGTPAAVVPTVVGYALDVESVSGATFEDMGFTAMDEPSGTAGASSIAVMVNASMGVGFTRVSATAGVGVMGVSPGAPVTNWCNPATGQIGSGTSGNGGAGGGTCTCGLAMFGGVAESSTGGPGGGATLIAGNGSSDPPVTGVVAPIDGVGGDGTSTAGSGGVCGVGHQGANAAAATGGAAGGAGTLSSAGWVTATAGAGGAGNPGQGGGGGGGGVTKGGTGGGAGGCGGNGGAGAGGGGASIAIAVVSSTTIFTSVALTTAPGGDGGAGAAGETGQTGGAGGTIGASQCPGGFGGDGAGGSGGGAGAGGPSVGIAWTGSTAPTVDGATVSSTAPTLSAPSSFSGGLAGGAGSVGAGGAVAQTGNMDIAGNLGLAGSGGRAAAVAKF